MVEAGWEVVDRQGGYQAGTGKDRTAPGQSNEEPAPTGTVPPAENPSPAQTAQQEQESGAGEASQPSGEQGETSSPGASGQEDADWKELEDGSVVIKANQVYDRLMNEFEEELLDKLSINPEKWFVKLTREEDGTVATVLVGDDELEVSGTKLAELLDLDFVDFEIAFQKDEGFTFEKFSGSSDESQSGTDPEPTVTEGEGDPQYTAQGEGMVIAPFSPPLGQSLSQEAIDKIKSLLSIKFLFQT